MDKDGYRDQIRNSEGEILTRTDERVAGDLELLAKQEMTEVVEKRVKDILKEKLSNIKATEKVLATMKAEYEELKKKPIKDFVFNHDYRLPAIRGRNANCVIVDDFD